MTHATRNKLPARYKLSPAIDVLEGRALLSASTAKLNAPFLVQAEVVKKSANAEVAKESVHASVVKKASTKVAKETKAATKVNTAPQVAPRVLAQYEISPLDTKKAQATGNPVPGALTPIQLETAYTTSSLPTTNQGQGQTIGIVDEYYDPNILSDANAFSTEYKLPLFGSVGGPTLTIVKDSALGTVETAPVGSTGDETSLDVEYAHAMAPKANIVMIFVPATGTLDNQFNELLHGVQLAAKDGASVVSLSYGYYETNIPGDPTPYPNQSFIDLPTVFTLDSTYLQTAPLTNIAVTVSTGDTAYPGYPGSSPNVIGVGGTELYLTASGQYSYETAWGGPLVSGAGGGGNDAFYSTPAYQSSNGVNINGKRADPDLSLNGGPLSAVSVYDSFDKSLNGGNPWTAVYGTSESSPLFAGIIALAQQDRAAAHKAPLTTAQIHTAIYSLYDSPAYSTYFHDVTLGRNEDAALAGYSEAIFGGYNAVTGYDQATGVGSPIAKTLVPYLAGL